MYSTIVVYIHIIVYSYTNFFLLLHVQIICTSVLLKLNSFCIDGQTCKPQPVKMVRSHSNITGVSYVARLLISIMLINRPHLMNVHILVKTVLNQRRKLVMTTPIKKSSCRTGLRVDRRNLGHQQNGQRT